MIWLNNEATALFVVKNSSENTGRFKGGKAAPINISFAIYYGAGIEISNYSMVA
jgi:hypothetical protein